MSSMNDPFSKHFPAFPYITLLIGLMRSVPAASHSEHSTKITVVVTLWLVTSFLMLHVPSILRNVFSVFNVWQRLVNMFNAHDDDRVPKFQVSHKRQFTLRIVGYPFSSRLTAPPLIFV